MDVVREEKFENEGLVKCYDRQGRIVEIAFMQSGNGCTIQYIETDALPDERIVRWKSGEVFRTWKEEGKTIFTRLKDEQDWHY
jgi:hypothetical protein